MAWGQLGPSKLQAPFSAAGPGASGAGCPQRPGGACEHEQAAAAATGRAHCAHMARMTTMTLRAPHSGWHRHTLLLDWTWKWGTECASGRC